MEKETSLSEKRKEVWEDMDDLDEHGTFHYPEKDVKEAVRRLKERFETKNFQYFKYYGKSGKMKDVVHEIIDEIFGEDLI